MERGGKGAGGSEKGEEDRTPPAAMHFLIGCGALLRGMVDEARLVTATMVANIDEDGLVHQLEQQKTTRLNPAEFDHPADFGPPADADPAGVGSAEGSAPMEVDAAGWRAVAREANLRARLVELERVCERQTRACIQMEEHAAELYRQRLAECTADRLARRAPDADLPLVTAGLSPQMTGYIAAAPASVRPFLVPSGMPSQQQREAAAGLAAHCCAVTLTLRLSLQEWFRRRIEGAAPPSFAIETVFLGGSPEALANKLDAVRFCGASAGLNTRASLERVAQWMLREIPCAGPVPCGIDPGGGGGGGAASAHTLPDGQRVSVVTTVLDEKSSIFDGELFVQGKQ